MEISGSLISGAFDKSRKRLAPSGIVFDYPSEQGAVFSGGENGFWRVVKDGASYYSYKGELLRNVTYQMLSPLVLKNGENWAFLEPGGRYVCVSGANGLLYEVTTDYPILNAYINKISCLILILDAGDRYEVQIFNSQGTPSHGRVVGMDGVYPVCAALADDGMSFCVSYLDTSRSAISGRLLYYYTDSGAKRYGTDEQSSFKAIEKPGAITTALWYSADNRLVCVADTEIFITSAKGDEIFAYPLSNQLNSCSFGDKMFGVSFGPPLANASEPLEQGSALVFGYGGEKLAEYSLDTEAINIYGESILLKNGGGYLLTDSKGRELWDYGASADISAVFPIDKRQALIAKASSAELYRIKRGAPDASDGRPKGSLE